MRFYSQYLGNSCVITAPQTENKKPTASSQPSQFAQLNSEKSQHNEQRYGLDKHDAQNWLHRIYGIESDCFPTLALTTASAPLDVTKTLSAPAETISLQKPAPQIVEKTAPVVAAAPQKKVEDVSKIIESLFADMGPTYSLDGNDAAAYVYVDRNMEGIFPFAMAYSKKSETAEKNNVEEEVSPKIEVKQDIVTEANSEKKEMKERVAEGDEISIATTAIEECYGEVAEVSVIASAPVQKFSSMPELGWFV
jgi:hypothetical protein